MKNISLGIATFGPTVVKVQNKNSNKTPPNCLLSLTTTIILLDLFLLGTWTL